MNIKQLKSEIRKNVEFNPFHEKYNLEHISNLLAELNDEKEDYEEIATLLFASLKCHRYFTEFSNYIKDVKDNTKLCFGSAIEIFMAFVNANYTNAYERIIKNASDTLSPIFMNNHKIESLDPAIADIDIVSVLESQIDHLNMVLNYFRHFENKLSGVSLSDIQNEQVELEETSQIAKTVLYSSIVNTIKSEYEEIIWNGGKIIYETQNKELKFYKSEGSLAILTAGLVRQYSLITQASISAENNLDAELFENQIRQHIKVKDLKNIQFNNGEVSIETLDGSEQEYLSILKSNLSAVSVFSSFMVNLELPNSQKLTVFDSILYMSSLQLLFGRISAHLNEKFKEEGYIKYGDIPNRISKHLILNYLISTFSGQKEKIIVFLELIICKSDKRISLWKTPLFEHKDFYYFTFLPNVSPNICYIIDELVERSGYPLEKRGKLFEQHVRSSCNFHLNKLNFEFRIINTQKLKTRDNSSEEIDLIIEFQTKILVFEIKCIKYSFYTRDFHNANKILLHATKQLKRKLNFIKKHKGKFNNEQLDVTNKEIIGCVITQFPIFTGSNFNNIPIIDFTILESYISVGEFSSVTMKIVNQKQKITNINRTSYYKDENTFNSHFKEYLHKPIPIKSLLKNVVFKFDRMSPSEETTKMYVQRAYIDDNYLKDCFSNNKKH